MLMASKEQEILFQNCYFRGAVLYAASRFHSVRKEALRYIRSVIPGCIGSVLLFV